jgi:hypothetical protein
MAVPQSAAVAASLRRRSHCAATVFRVSSWKALAIACLRFGLFDSGCFHEIRCSCFKKGFTHCGASKTPASLLKRYII